MADETHTDKPLATLAGAERAIDPPIIDPPVEEHAADPMTGEARLRAFEDEHFGENAVRINGRIERGSGSPYQMAHPSVREQYGKIEKLIEAEQKLAAAHGALMQADAEHEQAMKAVADAEKDADGAAAE